MYTNEMLVHYIAFRQIITLVTQKAEEKRSINIWSANKSSAFLADLFFFYLLFSHCCLMEIKSSKTIFSTSHIDTYRWFAVNEHSFINGFPMNNLSS